MPTVHLVFGALGAGKTTYARALADRAEATRFSIDDWMAGLYGPDLTRPLNPRWIFERVQRCERRIWATAAEVVRRGGNVVLDLGFMKRADRSRFIALCDEAQLPFQLHYLTAPHAQRRERVLARNTAQGETYAFEVTAGMFDFMEREFEAASESELLIASVTSTETPAPVGAA